jgi:hypothetical protein
VAAAVDTAAAAAVVEAAAVAVAVVAVAKTAAGAGTDETTVTEIFLHSQSTHSSIQRDLRFRWMLRFRLAAMMNA